MTSSRKPLDKDLYADVVAEAKSRFDVWPSAYASGWVVKTYKARGGRYAGAGRASGTGLTKWFGEEWVDLSRPIHDEDGELTGYEPCGRKTAQGASNDPAAYPKCRPLAEAMRMSPSEVKDAIKRKRTAEAKAGRGAKGRGGRGARAPVRVATYRANPDAVFDKLKEFGAPDAVAAKIAEVVEKVGTCTDAEAMTGKCMVISDRLARELDGMSYVDDYGDTQTVTAFSTQLWDVPKRLQNNALAHGHYVVKVESDSGVLWIDLTAAQFGAQGPGVVTGKAVPAVGGFETFWNERVSTYRANPYDPEDDPLSDVHVIATDELEDGTVVKYVASPFPYERKPLGHRDDPKVQGLVNLANLIGTQRRVSVAGVEKYLGDAERPPRMPPITVYETSDGRQYIADGHHRAFAALLRDMETFPAIIQLVRE